MGDHSFRLLDCLIAMVTVCAAKTSSRWGTSMNQPLTLVLGAMLVVTLVCSPPVRASCPERTLENQFSGPSERGG